MDVLQNKDGAVFSSHLISENIKPGVVVLGVNGTSSGADAYTGETEITPTLKDQVLKTSHKNVLSNINVKAVSKGLLQPYTSLNLPAGSEIKKLSIADKNDVFYIRPYVTSSGYYSESEMGKETARVFISDDEQAKIIYSNILTSKTILGVKGEYNPTQINGGTYGSYGTSLICKIIKEVDFTGATFSPSDMSNFFNGYYILKKINFAKLDFSEVQTLYRAFADCRSLKSVDFSNIIPTTDELTDMDSMFSGCVSLQTLDLSNFNTQNVTTMAGMFRFCYCLQTLDLSNFNTQKVTDISTMFFDCSLLQTLDLSSFDFTNIVDVYNTFYSCTKLANVTWGVNIGYAITAFSVADCPLTHDSCLDLFNKLATKTIASTLTLSATTKALMSDEEIAIATAKGWTVA